jgi:Flp pilus assembly protein TadG
MVRTSKLGRRRGTVILESAVVLPITFFFILGLVIGALGIFQYQLVAELAREGSRYASMHGSQYAQDTGNPAATQQDVRNAILASATTLNPSQLTVAVSWNSSNAPNTNTVTVTVTYAWSPLLYLTGPINLTSSSTVQMQY